MVDGEMSRVKGSEEVAFRCSRNIAGMAIMAVECMTG